MLQPHERIDDLQYKGLKIIQDDRRFCFGTDAVLLADFADVRRNDRLADLGTGTGILPILIRGRVAYRSCDAVEIQATMAEMAGRSVALNSLEQVIKVHTADLRDLKEVLPAGAYGAVVCNPPYKKAGSGIPNDEQAHAIARHELTCTMEDVCRSAARLLKNSGRLAMIQQSDRIMDIFFTMRQFDLEPKRCRLVQPRAGTPPNLILVEGVKQGKSYMKWESTLCVFDGQGNYTDEMNKIYHRGAYADE